MAETEFYINGGVKVTNTRAIMNGKTFSLANVTSVRKDIIPVDYKGMATLIFLGVMAAWYGFGSLQNATIGAVGVLLIAVGVAVALMSKPSYVVKLGSASGESGALVSKDQAEVDRIVEALSDAIVHRG